MLAAAGVQARGLVITGVHRDHDADEATESGNALDQAATLVRFRRRGGVDGRSLGAPAVSVGEQFADDEHGGGQARVGVAEGSVTARFAAGLSVLSASQWIYGIC